ncbi:uncharacterized protein [Elaeis guineensis]|uniref:Uncharacterized protein LOC105036256 n=1 Tax=Elaeis guineensis var. tenera TaxID=51953 RepID=A0A6I9QLL3_ELAGV|nr:uncharacterized protein LOC105036256 [Elaeis guineensis]
MKYGEITHFGHPQHKLRFEYAEIPFKCDGCKEAGIGSRFKCSLCDYDLHKQCALAAPSSILRHPFYPKCAFYLLPRPPGNGPRYCNACERDVSGLVYHCHSCGFDLHPCCANLPHVLDADSGGGGELRLFLHRKVSAPCHRCGRKGRSWSYRSACKQYNLHVACVMEMLVESWHEIYYGVGGGRDGKRGLVGINGMNRIPSIKGVGKSHHRSRKGKVKRCCELAAMAVQFIISAVLGDPTAIIAGVVGSFISR